MKKVGVALSGGVESTILAALLSTHYKVICYTQLDGAVNIPRINSITKYLGIEDTSIIDHQSYVPTWVGYIASMRGEVEKLYFGDTLIVDTDTHVKRLDKEDLDNIQHNTICRFPFYNFDKAEVMYIGKTLIPNFRKLFDMTRSCSEGRSGECGACFHCKERKWAMEKVF